MVSKFGITESLEWIFKGRIRWVIVVFVGVIGLKGNILRAQLRARPSYALPYFRRRFLLLLNTDNRFRKSSHHVPFPITL